MRTSYSSIDTFLQCPQKYKFQEIDRIRAPKSKEALFGSLIHNTLKFMFKREPLYPTLDEVINYFQEHWPTREVFNQESKNDPLKRSWTEAEEKIYFEDGLKMLKKFYERNAPWNFSVVDLESRFEVAIQDPKTGETHILAGVIDRIDKLPDGSLEIVDYKTGRRMPSQSALDKDLQLSLYSVGLHNRWPHVPIESIKLSLYFLKHGEKLSTQITPESAGKTKEKLLSTISEIQEKLRQGVQFEPMPSPLCDWCSFRPICPAWRHLYRNQNTKIKNQKEIDAAIKEYFEIKSAEQKNEQRLKELQGQIKQYMDQEGLTRVFGDEGVISKKTIQRYEYDFEKIKSVLSPLGKWEEVLKADETRLKRVMREIPESARREIENTRAVSKEYVTLTASTKKIKAPEDASQDEDEKVGSDFTANGA